MSCALGIPSSAAFVFLTWESVRLHLTEPSPSSASPSGNQLIDLLVGGAAIVAKGFALLGGAAKWALTLLAVASLLIIVLALILFLTSRGLHAGRPWARVLGILVALVAMLISSLILTSLRQPVPLTLSVAGAAGSLYIIWALVWRFNS